MALPVVASGLVESTEDERIRYSVKRGDVFFTRTSETADEVGFSSVCLKTIPDATFAGFVIRVRPVTEDLLPEFAQYYFRNPFVSQYFAKEMMVVTRASLNQDILKSLPVLIPPRDEQAQIAKYLGERRSYFDSLAANLRKQIETLEQYRKSLIHEYVTGVRRVV
jgi:type I restriction enzyme S subunit